MEHIIAKQIVYIIDNDPIILSLYSRLLISDSYEIAIFESPNSFLNSKREDIPSCILIDKDLSDEPIFRLNLTHVPTIIMASKYDDNSAIMAFRRGAFNCVKKDYIGCIDNFNNGIFKGIFDIEKKK